METKPKELIMLVDDDDTVRGFMHKALANAKEGYDVHAFEDYHSALQFAKENAVDLCITDLQLYDPKKELNKPQSKQSNPKDDGISLLKEIKKIDEDMAVIIMTGFGTVDSAVEAMKHGAFHYATKPINLDEIFLLVRRALDYRRLNADNRHLRKSLRKKYKFSNFIGDSDKMQEVFRLIERVADSDSTILIRGDNGTGKELVAQAIHHNSSRREKLFIPINCAALPKDLLEAELFGYEKGAFTGAAQATKKGRFEQAHGGTLFLDEIGEMDIGLQARVLRAIAEKSFHRVGAGGDMVHVDVRLIAATNRDLEKAVKEGKFRKDLYFRLNVIPLYLPKMCERRSDIPLLANHFLERLNKEKKKNIKGITKEAMDFLVRYEWPGNVRELENLMERFIILNETGTINIDDLPDYIRNKDSEDMTTLLKIPPEGIDLKKVVNDLENNLIMQALQRTNGNKNKAAELLKLNRTTLVEKIKKKKLDFSHLEEFAI
jgi:DNA-binding NtrC family response regulator